MSKIASLIFGLSLTAVLIWQGQIGWAIVVLLIGWLFV